MNLVEKQALVIEALEDGKARDITVLEVSKMSSFTDVMVVATGTSTTHVRSLGSRVAQALKDAGEPPLGTETSPQPDWVLVDAEDMVIHVMTESARAHYALEKLWEKKPSNRSESA
jgi:ribosome-associated protein